MLPFKTVLALVILATSAHTATADEMCVEGYLMDFFCIDQGFLFQDKETVKTQFPLSHPDVHMVKCLVGMPFCREDGYEILLDPIDKANDWCRGFNFDASGNEMVIAYAKANGKWTMETNPDGSACGEFCQGDGNITQGMRASIRGTVIANSTNSTPPTLQVTSVSAAGNCTASEDAMIAWTSFNGNCTSDPAPTPTLGSGTSTVAVGFKMIVMFVIVQLLLQ